MKGAEKEFEGAKNKFQQGDHIGRGLTLQRVPLFCWEEERRFIQIRGQQTYKGLESKYFRISMLCG